MKNKKLLFILPLLLAGLIFSCQNELTDIWQGKDKEWNATIERAKVIFSEYSPDFPCIQTRGLSDIRKSIVFEPVWDEAFIARHDDGSLTVETHIRLSKPLAVIPSESFEAYQSTKDVRYLQYLSRVVVLIKENSIPQAFLMTIVGSKDYMEAHDFQLWDVCYKNIPEDFSGMLLYHTLSGEFVNGWHVEEGHRYSTCEPVSEEDAELLSRSGTNCYIVESSYVTVDCVTNNGYNTYEGSDEIFVWTNTECGDPYRVIESYQVCDDTSDGNSGSSGGGYVSQDAQNENNPIIKTDDACQTRVNLGSNGTLKSKIKGLYEQMRKNPSGGEDGWLRTLYGRYIEPTKKGQQSIRFPVDEYKDEIIVENFHTHPTGILFPTFSDFKALATRYKNGHIEWKHFTYGIISEFGILILTIVSEAEFQEFCNNVLQENSDIQVMHNSYQLNKMTDGDSMIFNLNSMLRSVNSGMQILYLPSGSIEKESWEDKWNIVDRSLHDSLTFVPCVN